MSFYLGQDLGQGNWEALWRLVTVPKNLTGLCCRFIKLTIHNGKAQTQLDVTRSQPFSQRQHHVSAAAADENLGLAGVVGHEQGWHRTHGGAGSRGEVARDRVRECASGGQCARGGQPERRDSRPL